MTTRMLIDGLHEEETRVVIAQGNQLLEFDIESSAKKLNKGNLYLAKVTRVEPSLQAAFVEYGSGRQGFLPFSEIHPDYYQIPVADKQDLLRAQAAEREAEAQKVEAELEKAAIEPEHVEEFQIEEIVPHIPELVEIEQGEAPQEGQFIEPVQTMDAPSENLTQAERDENAEQALEMPKPEDLGSDEPYEGKRKPFVKRYKIQEVVKKGQVVLIQVIKEERGNKGASVTTYLSIPGRCCVLMPNTAKGGGVSRKINEIKERRRLKEIIDGLEVSDGMSIILRTAGEGRTKSEVTRDYQYLIKLWNKIREVTLTSTAPALVYEEGSVIKRSIRDNYSSDIQEIVVSGDGAYQLARDFMTMMMPDHLDRVIKHEDQVPLFNYYDIESQLASMNDREVVLKSGGYIVLDQTEALISVDVNSGRSTGERNVEDTATRTNIDAAYELARQLRLRDLSGLIVIDFIDMLDSRHRRQVERALKDALRQDRAKIQIGRISPFGLLEMSRQRLRSSLVEINMIECPSCKGVGIIRSPDSAMVQLARSIENELALAEEDGLDAAKVHVVASTQLALYFLNNKRKRIAELEEQYDIQISVTTDEMPPTTFRIQIEDDKGNKSRIITSEDRDVRLPQSREGKQGRRRNNDRKGRRDQRSRERVKAGPATLTAEDFANDPIIHDDPAEIAAIAANRQESGNNIEEVGAGDEGGQERGSNNGRRNNNRRGGGGRYNNNNRRGGGGNGGGKYNNRRRPRPDGEQRDQQGGQPQTGGESAPTQAEVKVPYRSDEPRPQAIQKPREVREPAYSEGSNGSDNQGDSDSQGNRKGWWRKIIE